MHALNARKGTLWQSTVYKLFVSLVINVLRVPSSARSASATGTERSDLRVMRLTCMSHTTITRTAQRWLSHKQHFKHAAFDHVHFGAV
jgi:hypothetical protein